MSVVSARCHPRRLVLICIIVALIYYLIVLVQRSHHAGSGYVLTRDRTQQRSQIEMVIMAEQNRATFKGKDGLACQHPSLDINSPEIMKFVSAPKPLDCDKYEPDWVAVNGSLCYITDYAKHKYGNVQCAFTDAKHNVSKGGNGSRGSSGGLPDLPIVSSTSQTQPPNQIGTLDLVEPSREGREKGVVKE